MIFLIAAAIIIYATGFWAGVGLVLLKYHDLKTYPGDFMLEDVEHDLQPQMVVRNLLVYAGLSWVGVWLYITETV